MEQEILKAFLFNLWVLFLFWGFGIYKFNHDNRISLGAGGVFGCYSRLKLKWRIITTFVGIIFSPALIILYLVFKIGNRNCGEYTKKYFIFFEEDTNICDSNLFQMF